MADEVKLLLLRHRLSCLKEKQRQVATEINNTKEQIIFEQDKLLKEKQSESK